MVARLASKQSGSAKTAASAIIANNIPAPACSDGGWIIIKNHAAAVADSGSVSPERSATTIRRRAPVLTNTARVITAVMADAPIASQTKFSCMVHNLPAVADVRNGVDCRQAALFTAGPRAGVASPTLRAIQHPRSQRAALTLVQIRRLSEPSGLSFWSVFSPSTRKRWSFFGPRVNSTSVPRSR